MSYAQVMKRKTLGLKAHTMLFQLRVFYRICKHHIETSYFNDQIMLIKYLNNIIYLSDTYMWSLNLIHGFIYARHFLHCLHLSMDET